MIRPIFAIASLLALAPVAAACNCSSGGSCQCGDTCSCGSDAADSSPDNAMTIPSASIVADDAAGPTTVHVGVEDFDFTANPVIHVGDTVQWDWLGGFHTVTSVTGSAEPFDSGFMVDGSFSFQFTQPGTFWYYCEIHGFDNGDGTAGGMAAFVTVLPNHFPGDTNNDGVVDLSDLNNVLNNFGSTGSNPGDDNSDNVVDLSDLNAVLNNFGSPHDAAALSAAVPEPASTLACLLAAYPLFARRRRSA